PLTATAPGQLSWAVAVPGLTAAVHCPGSVPVVMAAGQVTAGFSRSSTVTVWVQEARLPAASVAVQVIAVVPTGYRSVRPWPSARAAWTGRVTPLQPAWAVAMAQTWAPQRPAALGTTIAGEQVITTGGETLSRLPGQSPAVWVAIGVPSWRVP